MLSLLAELTDEQRGLLATSPLAERLPLLAQFRREKEADTLAAVARASGFPVLASISPLPKATEHLPLRLIIEYQALPVEAPEDSNLLSEAKSRPSGASSSQISNLKSEISGEAASDPTLTRLPFPIGHGHAAESDSSNLKPEVPNALHLATLWPPDPEMSEWIYAASGRTPVWHLADAKDVANTITQNFGVGAADIDDFDIVEDAGRPKDEVEDEDAALIRFVNEVIEKAVTDRATDIHFEPLKESLQIRYRIDGELVPIRLPDNLVNYQSAIISRLKIMAKLNISEKRRPQDGRISYTGGGSSNDLDIRISTIPTLYGESLSLRLLNQKSNPISISDLGLLIEDQDKVKSVLDLPHGIILVTGPTGSGKSTSLTAFIRHINLPGRRIITVEDPVEYEVPGVNQTQVHHDIGYNFASALRHILRQDPDVIMIGEIRDRETADIGIRAALTGHLVFSTLHTNDAPGALTRLTDMGIEPFLIASAVELLLAQRLVRRLCPHCKQPAKDDRRYLEACLTALGQPFTDENLHTTHYLPHGCEKCRKLGYRGRIALFEILRVNDALHELIIQKASAAEIRRVALPKGMVTLQSSGWRHAQRGNTSLSEVMRYADFGREGVES